MRARGTKTGRLLGAMALAFALLCSFALRVEALSAGSEQRLEAAHFHGALEHLAPGDVLVPASGQAQLAPLRISVAVRFPPPALLVLPTLLRSRCEEGIVERGPAIADRPLVRNLPAQGPPAAKA